jgi:hypothetical protein
MMSETIQAVNYQDLNRKLNSLEHNKELTQVRYTISNKKKLAFREIYGLSALKVGFWRILNNFFSSIAKQTEYKHCSAVVFAKRKPAKQSEEIVREFLPCAKDKPEDFEPNVDCEQFNVEHKSNPSYGQPSTILGKNNGREIKPRLASQS